MIKKKIAVFASGSGTNFQSIVDAGLKESTAFKVEILVCDKPNAKVIERATIANVPCFVFDPKTYDSKRDFEKQIQKQLEQKQIDLVALAGYMRLIGPTLLTAFEGKIINIHPSLLPAFPGKDAIGQAFDKKVKITGVTIHYVDAGMDTGPIIEQEAVRIEREDTREVVQEKIQRVEHQLFPEILHNLCVR
ncbi:phosphoribosylglycinamide formyltransferase-1 [Salirhabdus euzebyi]|uniref:Phosphoribosylglycinamide formyltransferase n=1 Tax=Salirhabdus euzebyi TaxID=394506 RepID=A0A841QA29_9BACI|nr:phosphoribosylglycinamide formyltransferase-1 [Salirhabdus euzebyi]